MLLARTYGPVGGSAGQTIRSSATEFNATGGPGSGQTFTDAVTNEGVTTQTINATSRTLGTYKTISTAIRALSDAHSYKYVDFQGITDNYQKVTFTVAPGQDRLETSIAYQNASATVLAARVRMDLVDPKGRLAAYSLPQGDGNYGHVEVATPTAGVWTAYIESRDTADGGTTGLVKFAAAVANYVPFGRVSPSTLTLAPGQTGIVRVTTRTNSTPGDSAGSLVLTSTRISASPARTGVPNVTTVPITLRATIPNGRESFTDTLTGGNGREFNTGVTKYYDLNVRPGTPELNSYITLANNPNNPFYDELVSPSGNAVAFGSNNMLTSDSAGNAASVPGLGSQLHVVDPAPGQWTLVVAFVGQVSGQAISTTYRVTTDQAAVPATAHGLPDSAAVRLKAGTTTTASVTVKNTGTSPESFFVDPRSTALATLQLAPQFGTDTTAEPLTVASSELGFLVPTETSVLGAFATTTGPADIQADIGYNLGFGDPDVGTGQGKTVSAIYAAPRIAQGLWAVTPTEVGPFPTAGPAETATAGMVVATRAFESGITTAGGDLWSLSTNPAAAVSLVVVNPGQSATILVHIKASGPARTVSGTLFIDDASLVDILGPGFPNANEVAALPYKYTVR